MSQLKEYQVDIGGQLYHVTSDDDYLEHIKGGFEPHMVKLFRTLNNDSKAILDIGANIGCTALLFGTMAQQVVAFEPSHSTFTFLEQNVARSGHENITLQNIGLGAEAFESTLTFTPSNRSGSFVSNQTQVELDKTTEQIVIRPLDETITSMGISSIDFIKIDVEGFEGEVLKGGRQTLERHRPVVVLELNHWCLNAFQRTSIPDFFDQLREIFPILLAVDNNSYLDLYNEDDVFTVMYHHIIHMRFPNIVACFDEQQLAQFRADYAYGFQESPPPAAPPPKPAVVPSAQPRSFVSIIRNWLRG